MFRFYIDITLGDNLEESVTQSKLFRLILSDLLNSCPNDEYKAKIVKNLQFRLGRDEDRSPKNYMIIDENGHAGKKKLKLTD